MKLFSSVFAGSSGTAVFGRKDYQQQMVIRQMVRQFALPIEIVTADICRAPDGLALSSRNAYLSASERAQATQLNHALHALSQAALEPGVNLAQLETDAMNALRAKGWQPDYLAVRRRSDLQLPEGSGRAAGQLVALGAARLGSTRLIDNLEF